MKKPGIIIVIAALALGGVLIFFSPNRQAPVAPVVEQPTTGPSPMTKTDEQASVTVVVTPIDISPASKEWKFDIGINTHTVPLDQDMTKVGTLVDENGKEYKPLRWEGALPGGHHREGVLVIAAITPMPKTITLKLTGIGGVVRNFVW